MRALPQTLSDPVEAASEALRDDSEGHLALPLRRRVWAAMGPALRDENDRPHGAGHRRRTSLAVLCVRHVLPLWEAAYPDNDGPQRMLALAEQVLSGAAPPDAADRSRGQFWTDVESLVYEDQLFVPSYVGYAAVDAVTTAQVDEEVEGFDEGELDENLDADQWDASFFASLAFASGAPGEQGSDPARRREFWRWYLREAVPAAYTTAPDDAP